MTTTGFSVTAREDPAPMLAEDALIRMVRERQFERYRAWLQTRTSYPRRWRDAGEDSEYVFYLTVEELEQLSSDLTAKLMPLFERRMADPSKRPHGSVPVQLLLLPSDRVPGSHGRGGGQGNNRMSEPAPAAMPDTAATPGPVPLRRNSGFRMFWIGQLLSDTGSEMDLIAYPLLILALTHSPVLVMPGLKDSSTR